MRHLKGRAPQRQPPARMKGCTATSTAAQHHTCYQYLQSITHALRLYNCILFTYHHVPFVYMRKSPTPQSPPRQGYIIQALLQSHSGTFAMGSMVLYAALYWFLAAVTYGAFIPSGLFTPSLVFGGCIG